MLCSVWDWQRLEYDYYSCPDQVLLGGWKPLTGLGIRQSGEVNKNQHPVGIDIEDALPNLPANCKKVGHGTIAKGQICVIRNKVTLGESASPTVPTPECSTGPNPVGFLALGVAVGVMSKSAIIPLVGLATSVFIAGSVYGETGKK